MKNNFKIIRADCWFHVFTA